jgi:hypothetical protein
VLAAFHRFGKGLVGQQEFSGECVAEDLNRFFLAAETLDIVAAKRIDTAGLEEQMSELVKKREYLSRFSGAVIDVNQRERFIIQTEAGEIVVFEGILKYNTPTD